MKNQLKTTALLGLLTALLLWVGSLWGQGGLLFALLFSILINFGSYWYSDSFVLSMYNAQEAGTDSDIYKLVQEVVEDAEMPMPDVYVIPSESPNAFATGRNPDNAAVAFTRGILKLLNDEELRGVTAHELAHVQNRDTLIQTVAATIAGVISYIAMIARWGALFGMGGRDQQGGVLELLVLAIVTPLAATIIQLAISRSREFFADKVGARIVGGGDGLASALKKLEQGAEQVPMDRGSTSTASLFIVNPFSTQTFARLFSTHPPTEERIERLQTL